MLVLYMWGWGWVALCVKLLYFLLCPVEIVFVIISIIYILQVVFFSYPVEVCSSVYIIDFACI